MRRALRVTALAVIAAAAAGIVATQGTWPPPLTRSLFVTRVSIAIAMAAGLFLYFSELPLPWPAVAVLAVSTAVAIVAVLLALESIPPAGTGGGVSTAERGHWPDGVQRAFVEGGQWWQFHKNRSTAFGSERREMEAEAVRRYGDPVTRGRCCGHEGERR